VCLPRGDIRCSVHMVRVGRDLGAQYLAGVQLKVGR